MWVLVSELTYTVSSGTLNCSIPYHTIPYRGQNTSTDADGFPCVLSTDGFSKRPDYESVAD